MNTLNKTLLLGGFIAVALIIAGCGNKDDELGEGAKSIDKKALQALNIKGAPNWVLNGGQGNMSAIGGTQIINNDLQYARTEALALARDELARQVATEIEGVINRAASASSGTALQEAQITRASEQITKQTVSQTLSGTKQTDTWITDDAKQIFVLIKLNPELKAQLQANVKKEINKTSLPSNVKKEAARAIDSSFVIEEQNNNANSNI